MKIIGLTGGIGSGKSTVAHYFREMGIPVIDADQTGHDLLSNDMDIQQAAVEMFGDDIHVNGVLSREKLAARVFENEEARKKLNALLHPAIISAIMQQCRELHVQGCGLVVVEAALLGENARQEPWLHGLILVLAEQETRIERLIQSRNMEDSDARQRIAAQVSPEIKKSIANWTIHNDQSLEELHKQVNALAAELLKFAAQ